MSYFVYTFVAALMSVPALGLLPLGAWLVAMIYLADFVRKWTRH
jgi:hypothetical protein